MKVLLPLQRQLMVLGEIPTTHQLVTAQVPVPGLEPGNPLAKSSYLRFRRIKYQRDHGIRCLTSRNKDGYSLHQYVSKASNSKQRAAHNRTVLTRFGRSVKWHEILPSLNSQLGRGVFPKRGYNGNMINWEYWDCELPIFLCRCSFNN